MKIRIETERRWRVTPHVGHGPSPVGGARLAHATNTPCHGISDVVDGKKGKAQGLFVPTSPKARASRNLAFG